MPGPAVRAPPAPLVPGWYGKIPALGDFASRRLPPDFIAAWDDWLQRLVVAGRAQLGEGWQAACLRSPGWRFVLLPGACGATCWAGLLMPSRDKVGRCFPLTIALGLDPQRDTFGDVFAAGDWFDALEAIALAARDHATPLDAFDAALLQTPWRGMRSQALDEAASHVLAAGPAGRTFWWQKGDPHVPAPLLACCGMPGGSQAALLLAGAR
ncbi:MAG: type VI secretion system-associated protein TagF [Telluria sp.]